MSIVTGTDLDTGAPMPLYQQLADILRERITSGELRAGDRLPTEQSLSRKLAIGVSTVRTAYAQLVSEGIVSRRAGRGTFVSEPKLSRQLDGIYNFTSEIRRSGRRPSSQLVSFRKIIPDTEIAHVLHLSVTDTVWEIRRLRLADDIVIMLENSSIPTRLCPNLTESDVKDSLYERVTALSGSAPAEAHEVHEAVVITTAEAKLLERKAGAAAFLITRTTVNGRGDVIEYCKSVVPGDHTRYEMVLRPDATNVTKLHV